MDCSPPWRPETSAVRGRLIRARNQFNPTSDVGSIIASFHSYSVDVCGTDVYAWRTRAVAAESIIFYGVYIAVSPFPSVSTEKSTVRREHIEVPPKEILCVIAHRQTVPLTLNPISSRTKNFRPLLCNTSQSIRRLRGHVSVHHRTYIVQMQMSGRQGPRR